MSESVIDGCLLNNGSVMNSSDSSNMKVWIDEIMCEGIEQSLAECRRNHWGEVDCFHKEDAGCICQPLPTADDGSVSNNNQLFTNSVHYCTFNIHSSSLSNCYEIKVMLQCLASYTNFAQHSFLYISSDHSLGSFLECHLSP